MPDKQSLSGIMKSYKKAERPAPGHSLKATEQDRSGPAEAAGRSDGGHQDLLEELKKSLRSLRRDQMEERRELLKQFGVGITEENDLNPGKPLTPSFQLLDDPLTLKEYCRQLFRSYTSLQKTNKKLRIAAQKDAERISNLKSQIDKYKNNQSFEREAQRTWTEQFSYLSAQGHSDSEFDIYQLRKSFLDLSYPYGLDKILGVAFKKIREGDLRFSHACLDTFRKVVDFRTPTILQELIDYYEKTLHATPHSEPYEGTIIHAAIWGKSYAERFLRYCLASLMAPGNLPKSRQRGKQKLLLHTDEETQYVLESSDLLAQARLCCDVEILTFPGSIRERVAMLGKENKRIGTSANYWFLGAFQSLALAQAIRQKSHLMLLVPDIVVEEQLLSKIGDLFEAGYKVVTSQTPTLDIASLEAELEKGRHADGSIRFKPEALAGFQVAHLHSAFAARTVTPGNGTYFPCAQQLFPCENGFVIRAFHYHPISMSAQALSHLDESKLRLLPADDYILSSVVDGTNVGASEVYLPASTKEIALIGLGDGDGSPFHVPDSDPAKTMEAMSDAYIRMLKHRPLTAFEEVCLANRVIMTAGLETASGEQARDHEFLAPVLAHIQDPQSGL